MCPVLQLTAYTVFPYTYTRLHYIPKSHAPSSFRLETLHLYQRKVPASNHRFLPIYPDL